MEHILDSIKNGKIQYITFDDGAELKRFGGHIRLYSNVTQLVGIELFDRYKTFCSNHRIKNINGHPLMMSELDSTYVDRGQYFYFDIISSKKKQLKITNINYLMKLCLNTKYTFSPEKSLDVLNKIEHLLADNREILLHTSSIKLNALELSIYFSRYPKYASMKCIRLLLKYCLPNYITFDTIKVAVSHSTLKVLKMLDLSRGKHHTDESGQNLTFYAISKPDILQYLLDNGVDCDNENIYGETPLMFCVRKYSKKYTQNYLDSINILLKNGANILAEDQTCTPVVVSLLNILSSARCSKNLKVVDDLTPILESVIHKIDLTASTLECCYFGLICNASKILTLLVIPILKMRIKNIIKTTIDETLQYLLCASSLSLEMLDLLFSEFEEYINPTSLMRGGMNSVVCERIFELVEYFSKRDSVNYFNIPDGDGCYFIFYFSHNWNAIERCLDYAFYSSEDISRPRIDLSVKYNNKSLLEYALANVVHNACKILNKLCERMSFESILEIFPIQDPIQIVANHERRIIIDDTIAIEFLFRACFEKNELIPFLITKNFDEKTYKLYMKNYRLYIENETEKKIFAIQNLSNAGIPNELIYEIMKE